jgi:hypothetical protein
LKEASGGALVVLREVTKDEVNLVAIGYCYSHKAILHFVHTENAGDTAQGDPNEMKYTDREEVANKESLLPSFYNADWNKCS